MVLTKDGATITLDNNDHISAFLSNGWTEAKASVPPVKAEEKPEEKAEEVVEEVKVEKPKTTKKKQEK